MRVPDDSHAQREDEQALDVWILSLRLLLSVVAGVVAAALLNRLLPAFLVASVLSAVSAAVLAYFLAKTSLRHNDAVTSASARNSFAILSSILVVFATLFLLTFGPLNVDRSFSVWMLRNVSEQDGIPTPALKEQASTFFNPSSGEIERRIDEQRNLGNVQIQDDVVQLTSRGAILVRVNEVMARFFGLNPNYALGGE